jgi:hypothetical protein
LLKNRRTRFALTLAQLGGTGKWRCACPCPRGSRARPARAAGIAAAALAILIAGCASSRPGNQPSPPPRSGSARPDTLTIAADNFVDTDGNRYRDSAVVVVYLFSEKHTLPMQVEGEFAFILQSHSGQRLAEWRFDRQATAAAMQQLPPGPGYIFQLSLLESGTDRIEEREADLIAAFLPASSGPVAPVRRGVPLLVGPVTRGR